MANQAEIYKKSAVEFSDEQLVSEAKEALAKELDWKLDILVDECEKRGKGRLIDEVYDWYAASL